MLNFIKPFHFVSKSDGVRAGSESESEWFTSLVIRQIDNTSPGGCARWEISPWLSQEMQTWLRYTI